MDSPSEYASTVWDMGLTCVWHSSPVPKVSKEILINFPLLNVKTHRSISVTFFLFNFTIDLHSKIVQGKTHWNFNSTRFYPRSMCYVVSPILLVLPLVLPWARFWRGRGPGGLEDRGGRQDLRPGGLPAWAGETGRGGAWEGGAARPASSSGGET